MVGLLITLFKIDKKAYLIKQCSCFNIKNRANYIYLTKIFTSRKYIVS